MFKVIIIVIFISFASIVILAEMLKNKIKKLDEMETANASQSTYIKRLENRVKLLENEIKEKEKIRNEMDKKLNELHSGDSVSHALDVLQNTAAAN